MDIILRKIIIIIVNNLFNNDCILEGSGVIKFSL